MRQIVSSAISSAALLPSSEPWRFDITKYYGPNADGNPLYNTSLPGNERQQKGIEFLRAFLTDHIPQTMALTDLAARVTALEEVKKFLQALSSLTERECDFSSIDAVHVLSTGKNSHSSLNACHQLIDTKFVDGLAALCNLGLTHSNSTVSDAAALALQYVKHPATEEWLIEHLKSSPNPDLRLAISRALCEKRSKAVATALIEAGFFDPIGSVRIVALEALRKHEHPNTLKQIREWGPYIEDDTQRAYAMAILKGKKDRATVEFLETLLNNPLETAKVRAAAAAGLAQSPFDSATKALCLVGLCDDAAIVRVSAALALSGSEDSDVRKKLLNVMAADRSVDVQVACIEALEPWIHEAECQQFADTLLSTDIPAIQAQLLNSFDSTRHPILQRAVATLITTKPILMQATLWQQAEDALLELSDLEAAETLCKLNPFSLADPIQLKIIECLSTQNNSVNIERLQRLEKGGTEAVSASASSILRNFRRSDKNTVKDFTPD